MLMGGQWSLFEIYSLLGVTDATVATQVLVVENGVAICLEAVVEPVQSIALGEQ